MSRNSESATQGGWWIGLSILGFALASLALFAGALVHVGRAFDAAEDSRALARVAAAADGAGRAAAAEARDAAASTPLAERLARGFEPTAAGGRLSPRAVDFFVVLNAQGAPTHVARGPSAPLAAAEAVITPALRAWVAEQIARAETVGAPASASSRVVAPDGALIFSALAQIRRSDGTLQPGAPEAWLLALDVWDGRDLAEAAGRAGVAELHFDAAGAEIGRSGERVFEVTAADGRMIGRLAWPAPTLSDGVLGAAKRWLIALAAALVLVAAALAAWAGRRATRLQRLRARLAAPRRALLAQSQAAAAQRFAGLSASAAQLAREADSAGARQALAALEAELRAVEGLVLDGGALVAAESGAGALDLRPYSPSAVAERALETLRPGAARPSVALELTVAPGLEGPRVGDPLRLGRVIAALLAAAEARTTSGRISATLQTPRADRLRVEIADTGAGLSEDLLAQIEGRAPEGGSDLASRTLGPAALEAAMRLAAARASIEEMGGTIGAETLSGVGSRVWFEVPAPPAAFAPEPMLELTGGEAPAKRPALGARRTAFQDPEARRAAEAEAPLTLDAARRVAPTAETLDAPPPPHGAMSRKAASARRDGTRRRSDAEMGEAGPSSPPPPPPPEATTGPGGRVVGWASSLVGRAGPTARRRARCEDAVEIPTAPPPESAGPRPSPGPRRPRVLVAEDNSFNRRLIAQALDPLECELVETVDGRDALEAFLAGRFELVLLDIDMPVTTGDEVIREIRALGDDRSETPIIALARAGSTLPPEELRAIGASGTISKPIDLMALRRRVRALLEAAAAPARRGEASDDRAAALGPH